MRVPGGALLFFFGTAVLAVSGEKSIFSSQDEGVQRTFEGGNPTPVLDPCENTFGEARCRLLAREGRCEKRSVMNNCPAVCKPECGGDPGGALAAGPDQCENTFGEARCKLLAREGRCEKRSVMNNCPALCKPECGGDFGTAPTPPPVADPCDNTFAIARCNRLAREGKCERRFVMINCPTACNPECGGDPGAAPTPTPVADPCDNTFANARCNRLAGEGRCEKRFVMINCPAACNPECGGDPGPAVPDGHDGQTVCEYTDNCNGEIVQGFVGGMIQFSCGDAFLIMEDCGLDQVVGDDVDDGDQVQCDFVDICNGEGIWGFVGDQIRDSCGSNFVVEEDCSLSLLGADGVADPNRVQCDFVDPCSTEGIWVFVGDQIRDSCGDTFVIEADCSLTQVGGDGAVDGDRVQCDYVDICNGEGIWGFVGDQILDSCGSNFVVEEDCSLTLVDADGVADPNRVQCDFVDPCSAEGIWGFVGDQIRDSCGDTFVIEADCSLTQVGGDGAVDGDRVQCDYVDVCNGEGIWGFVGDQILDSCGDIFVILEDCRLDPVGGDDGDNGDRMQCDYVDECNGEGIWGFVGDQIRDSCGALFVILADCGLAELGGDDVDNGDRVQCDFVDPCSAEGIWGFVGDQIRDSCGDTFVIEADCSLTQVGGDGADDGDRVQCDFVDPCSAEGIWGFVGDEIRDSCGDSFVIEADCSLSQVGGDGADDGDRVQCDYVDECNGEGIWGFVGDEIRDSCGNTFVILGDCGLTNIGVDGGNAEDRRQCDYEDACSGEGIWGFVGDQIRDSCGDTFLILEDCGLANVGGDDANDGDRIQCDFVDTCSGAGIWGFIGDQIRDTCGDTFVILDDCALFNVNGNGADIDARRQCDYTDECNGEGIWGFVGDQFQNSCGDTFVILEDCGLEQIGGDNANEDRQQCDYVDECNGEGIWGFVGDQIVNSCGDTFVILEDCTLDQVGGDDVDPGDRIQCDYVDDCNGEGIWGFVGDDITDSCGRTFTILADCGLAFKH